MSNDWYYSERPRRFYSRKVWERPVDILSFDKPTWLDTLADVFKVEI